MTPWTVRECHVVFKDLRGFTHSSLMRAAAQALKELEEGDLPEGFDLVEILTRTVHTIHISKVKDWLRSGASPKEIAAKRDLLPRAKPTTR